MSHPRGAGRSRRLLALTFGLLAFGPLAAHATPADTSGRHLGGPFVIDGPTPIAELTSHPERYFNQRVRIEGVIASACTNEGCFIEVVPDGGGEGVVVNFPELVHLFPTHCAGARAVVEGLFYQKVYPAARLLHWQGHSFHAGEPMPDFALVRRIGATAAFVGGKPGAIPPVPRIAPTQTDRIDLAAAEFEAEGFGTGRKTLAPGDSTEAHGTGSTRELVFCLEGALTVARSGLPTVVLRPGEMSYIAPETRHALRNDADRPATYLFVYAKRIEPEKPHEH